MAFSGESSPYLSHDLVNLKRGQRGRLFFQFGTPCSQDFVPAALCPLVKGFISDLLDRRFPGFDVHRPVLCLSAIRKTDRELRRISKPRQSRTPIPVGYDGKDNSGKRPGLASSRHYRHLCGPALCEQSHCPTPLLRKGNTPGRSLGPIQLPISSWPIV